MNSTKLTEIEGTINIYPNLIHEVDTSLTCVKSFLPFIKKYSFLDGFNAFDELLAFALEAKGFIPNNKAFHDMNLYSEIHRISTLFITIHARLNGWSKELGNNSSVESLFNEIVSSYKDIAPLVLVKYIDAMMLLDVEDYCEVSAKTMKVAAEIRKVFFSIFALNTNLDFSAYLEE